MLERRLVFRAALVLGVLSAAGGAGCVPVAVMAELQVDEGPVAPPDPTVERQVVVQYAGPGDEGSVDPPTGPSPADRLRPDPIPFRLGAGRGALGRLDLAVCRQQGLPPGYLHVHVTFRHDGRVVHAAVESPEAPPGEALACIGEQLQVVAMVPAFDGGDVTISKSYFVN
jgi:hypothetical protein